MIIKKKFSILIYILMILVSYNIIYGQVADSGYYDDSYAEENSDSDYTYEDEYTDDTVNTPLDNENYYEQELSEDPKDEVREEKLSSTNKIEVAVPILESYQSPFLIDPQDPTLPPTHQLQKIRGTIWRGSERYIKPNEQGVLTSQRLYVFFDKGRDAIAYRYAPYDNKQLPSMPFHDEFIPLIPLLQTNTFVPINSKTLTELSNFGKKTNVTPILEISEPITDYADDFIDEEIIEEPTTEAAVEEIDTANEPTEEITEEIVEEPIEEMTEEPITNEEIIEESNEIPTTEEFDDSEEYEEYTDETAALTQVPLSFFAQEMTYDNDQYFVNIGGDTSGIFVYKTKNTKDPYTVIFLSLEGGMVLYEHRINNSFDVRASWSEASKQARELYIKILKEKINMKKFQRVNIPQDFVEY